MGKNLGKMLHMGIVMGLGETLGNIYTSIEDKWYNFLEFLDGKGIPVHVYNNFLEEHGIPSFAFTIALIFILIGLIYGLGFVTPNVNPALTVSFRDELGNNLTGVNVKISDEQGLKLFEGVKSSGDTIELKGVRIGSQLAVDASKQNYESRKQTIPVNGEAPNTSLVMKRAFKFAESKIRLVDSETGTPVRNAAVTLEFAGTTIQGKSDSDGIVSLKDVPQGVDVSISINADGYETIQEVAQLSGAQVLTKQLPPRDVSFAGKSDVLVAVFDFDSKQKIGEVKIKILNSENDDAISDVTDEDGEYSEKIEAGTGIKVTVEKEGYIKFDGIPFTVRKQEELVEVFLRKGGSLLTVNVLTETGSPINEADVQLFNSELELVEEKITGFGGAVEFTGLEPNSTYYLTGFKAGFLPARKSILPAEIVQTNIQLIESSTQNSVPLFAFIADSGNKAAGNAVVRIFEKLEDRLLPSGIPAQQTNVSGFLQLRVEPDKIFIVRAQKGIEFGEIELKAERGKENEARIRMQVPLTVFTLRLTDVAGNPVAGKALIVSGDNETLFDGNIVEGGVLFDAQGKESIAVKVSLADGTTWNETLNIKGRNSAKLTVVTEPGKLVPEIEFKGILDSEGNEVQGITRGEFYWLKFETKWIPGAYDAGIHVRIGEDDVQFADSQGIGIAGFETEASGSFFGKSFTPMPAPGNETLDRSNAGKAGELNKFLELFFTQLENTKIVKVKIQAVQSMPASDVKVHFRAWSELGGKQYRQPEDKTIADALFSAEKLGLYAETKTAEVKVTTTKADCRQDICANYAFISGEGTSFKEDEFFPFTGQIYALEIRLNAKKQITPSIVVSTDRENPSLSFTGQQVQSFGVFPDRETDSVEANVQGVRIIEGEERAIRIFFKAKKAENSFVRARIAAGNEILDRTFNFNISEEKELDVQVVPERANVGDNFVVLVKELETTNFVDSAALRLLNQKKELVRSIVGNASTGKGLNGEYKFSGNLEPGIYTVTVSAAGFKRTERALLVGREDLIKVTAENVLEIEKGKASASKTALLENKSRFNISGLTYELKLSQSWPQELELSVALPETIQAGRSDRVNIQVNFTGETDLRLHGEAELIVTGYIDGKFPVTAKGRVTVNYNKELPSECLKFDKESLQAFVVGAPNTNEKVTLTVKNDCGRAVSLQPSFESSEKDSELSIDVPQLALKDGEQKEITITVNNRIGRMTAPELRRPYRIFFGSASLTKSIELLITLRDPLYSLQASNNLVIFLSPEPARTVAGGAVLSPAETQRPGYYNQPAGTAYGFAPLFIRNYGFAQVESIRFSVYNAPKNVQISILPDEGGAYSRPIPSGYNPVYSSATFEERIDARDPDYLPDNRNSFAPTYGQYAPQQALTPFNQPLFGQSSLFNGILLPGQQITPPKYVYASTSVVKELSLEAQPLFAQILVTGTIQGRRYNLSTVNVWINVSGAECLKIVKVDELNFIYFG